MQLALSPVDAFMILYETVVEGARIVCIKVEENLRSLDRMNKYGMEKWLNVVKYNYK